MCSSLLLLARGPLRNEFVHEDHLSHKRVAQVSCRIDWTTCIAQQKFSRDVRFQEIFDSSVQVFNLRVLPTVAWGVSIWGTDQKIHTLTIQSTLECDNARQDLQARLVIYFFGEGKIFFILVAEGQRHQGRQTF